MTTKVLNSKLAAAYAKAGTAALKKFGVHHLSKSSAENLLECANKFHLKSLYNIAKPQMFLGNIVHGVLEKAADSLVPYSEKVNVKTLEGESLKKFIAGYSDFKTEVFSKLNFSQLLIEQAQDQLADLTCGREVLYPEGMGYGTFAANILATVETMTKSLTKEHWSELLDCPVLSSEMPVIYFTGSPNEVKIPYLGYADMLMLDPETGKVKIVDLKTAFSGQSQTWNNVGYKFQLWLYAQALKQMGYVDYTVTAEIKKVLIDLGLKRKNKPTTYTIKTEVGRLTNLDSYNERFQHTLDYAQRIIENGIQVFANSSYGCGSCEYKDMCDEKILNDDWVIEGGANEESD